MLRRWGSSTRVDTLQRNINVALGAVCNLCHFLRCLGAEEHDHSSLIDGAPPRGRVNGNIAEQYSITL